MGEIGTIGLCHGGDDGEDEKECDVYGCSPEVDASTAEPGRKEPGYCVGDELETAGN